MSRSAATAPERRVAARQLALLPAASPTAEQLIHALHAALYGALVPKRDGTRHHRSCLNRTVNASVTPCSDPCLYANGALLLAEDYADSHPRPRPDRRRGGGRAS
jgi:hypothetical protein